MAEAPVLLIADRRYRPRPSPLPAERDDLRSEALKLGMVHEWRPAAELRDYTYEIASQLVRTPAALLALVKDNLNEAEHDVERRRWLFGHEAHNQGEAGRTMFERMQQAESRSRSVYTSGLC